MSHLSTTLALALSAALSFAASAGELGMLNAQPVLQTLSISAPDVTFSTSYAFTLAAGALVSATATPLSLRVGDVSLWGSSAFSLQLFDAESSTLMAVGEMVDGSLRIQDVSLPASRFYFQVSGITSGVSGDSYTFAAATAGDLVAEALPAVPEPGSLWLMALGLAAIGIVGHRRTAHARA
jgi:hypothetical protein